MSRRPRPRESVSHANRGVRAIGTLLVALSLIMIVTSIVLANFDGTFTRFAVAPDASDTGA